MLDTVNFRRHSLDFVLFVWYHVHIQNIPRSSETELSSQYVAIACWQYNLSYAIISVGLLAVSSYAKNTAVVGLPEIPPKHIHWVEYNGLGNVDIVLQN